VPAELPKLAKKSRRKKLRKRFANLGNDLDSHEMFYERITTLLLVNEILVNLSLRTEGEEEVGRWLQPLFVAMQINSSLKSLDVDAFHLTNE
jgi:hypothetical protein